MICINQGGTINMAKNKESDVYTDKNFQTKSYLIIYLLIT